jgi:alkylation response protein AidB-like acyl-CoA dehydrogenase
MSHSLADLSAQTTAPAHLGLADMLDAELAPLVDQIDEGLYPVAVMRRLGEMGVFSHHLSQRGPIDMPRAIADMATVAASCMSTAFCIWCQDACGWYLENTDNAPLRARLQGGIADGALLGGTGLSNPIKALSKLEPFALQAKRVAGGYIVNGVLPWVSNLGDGHWLGTIFQDAADPDHKMMAMVQCGQQGVEIRQSVHFSTLEGTGTYVVRFRQAFIADDAMLADPLSDMVARIRPGFVLLQAGMGLGIIRASIDGMHKANRSHGQTNSFLPKGPSAFEEALDAANAELMRLAATPRDGSADYVRAVLTARLRTGELTLEATQAGMLHAGAKAFITGSPVQRRLREGYFVAMITPSIRHLTQELSRMAAN